MTTKLCFLLMAIACLLLHPTTAQAQDNIWVGAADSTNEWLTDSNWSATFYPDPNGDANAKVGADNTLPDFPTAIEMTLSTDLSATPSPRVVLGEGSGYQGTLNLQSGAKFVTSTGVVATSASFDVGINGGLGFLNVTGTGQLTVGGRLSTVPGGDQASTIALQDSATVTANELFSQHNTRIVGSDVSFSVADFAILGGGGTHEWEFSPSTGPSVLNVGGELSLDGTLKIDTLGQTPSVGDSYVIADSQSVIQAFTNIDTSDITGFDGLGEGVAARVISTEDPGGSNNGVLTRVVIEQQPVLIVHRRTGEVSLRNPSASNASVEFDSYVVGSPSGSLNDSNWSSIAPSNGWQQANPTEFAISEINPLSSQSVAADTTIALGALYQPAGQDFGVETEDVTFQFAPIGEDYVNGLVVYEGVATDTLTLNVDRTTGAAQIINGFREAVSIDSYVVRSDSEALDSVGFSPIGGDWQLALNTLGIVSELNPLTSLELSANQAQSLGTLFDFNKVGADEDFVFEFSLPGENVFRLGEVLFDDELTVLQEGLLGDFNDDGFVDLADYTVWRNNLGADSSTLNGNGSGALTVVVADYELWKNNFGASSAASSVGLNSVPEPSAMLLVTLALVGVALLRNCK